MVTNTESINDVLGDGGLSSVAILEKDSSGNTLGFSDGVGGEVQSLPNGNIIKQRIGRATVVRSNAGTARTEQVAWLMRKNALAVRFGFEGYATGTVPIDLCKFTSVATAADIVNANAGTIQSVLFSAGATGTVPAKTATNRPGLLLSDWIDCDISAGRYLVARVLFSGTNPFDSNYTSYGTTGAQMEAITTAMKLWGWGTNLDKVTAFDNVATWTDALGTSNMGIPYIEYLSEARTVNVCCVGDSTTVGQVNTGDVAFPPVQQACEELSSANVLYSPVAKGWGGSTSAEHYAIAIDVITNTPPDVLIYQVWTQNNTAAAASSTEMRYAMDIVKRCRAAGIVPMLITGIPLVAWVTPTNDAYEAARIALNVRVRALEDFGVRVIDADAILTDGSSPANYLTAYGGDAHPNAAGYAALVEEYKSALRHVQLA
jgi:hypothetical protein